MLAFQPSQRKTGENLARQKKIKDCNNYIDLCLISIYQPCDVVVNKPLKQKIRKRYFEKSSSHLVKPGEKFKINREDLNDIIELAYEDVNKTLYDTHSIRKSFAMCGLDPYVRDKYFKKYVASLEESSIYKILSDSNEALNM